jgi:hypothetical protein
MQKNNKTEEHSVSFPLFGIGPRISGLWAVSTEKQTLHPCDQCRVFRSIRQIHILMRVSYDIIES